MSEKHRSSSDAATTDLCCCGGLRALLVESKLTAAKTTSWHGNDLSSIYVVWCSHAKLGAAVEGTRRPTWRRSDAGRGRSPDAASRRVGAGFSKCRRAPFQQRSAWRCCLPTDRVCWGRLKHRHSRCALRRYLMFRRIVCVFRKSIKSVSFARKSSLRRFAWRRRYLSFRCELFERQFNRHSTFISRTLVHYNSTLLLRYNFQPNCFIC